MFICSALWLRRPFERALRLARVFLFLRMTSVPADTYRMIDTVTDETPREEPSRPGTMKLSINVAHEIGDRLRRLAFDRRVSESSIVEVALQALYADRDDHEMAHVLREGGATLRRKRVAA